MVERLNDCVPRHIEPAAQIILERDAEFVAGLDETEEGIAAVPPDVASRPGADLAPCDLTANVVLRIVGVERDFRTFQHHQQFGPIGMQPRQQAIPRGEASATEEYAVEACGSPLAAVARSSGVFRSVCLRNAKPPQVRLLEAERSRGDLRVDWFTS